MSKAQRSSTLQVLSAPHNLHVVSAATGLLKQQQQQVTSNLIPTLSSISGSWPGPWGLELIHYHRQQLQTSLSGLQTNNTVPASRCCRRHAVFSQTRCSVQVIPSSSHTEPLEDTQQQHPAAAQQEQQRAAPAAAPPPTTAAAPSVLQRRCGQRALVRRSSNHQHAGRSQSHADVAHGRADRQLQGIPLFAVPAGQEDGGGEQTTTTVAAWQHYAPCQSSLLCMQPMPGAGSLSRVVPAAAVLA